MRLVCGVYDSLPWIGVSTMLVALVFVPRGKRLFSCTFRLAMGPQCIGSPVVLLNSIVV